MPRRRDPNSIMNDNDTALQPGSHTATPETKLRVAQVAEKISKGWTKFNIYSWMESDWGIKEQSQSRYWNAALSTLAKNANDSEYVEEMRQKAIATLDRAIQEEIALSKHKELNTSRELMVISPRKKETKTRNELHRLHTCKTPESGTYGD